MSWIFSTPPFEILILCVLHNTLGESDELNVEVDIGETALSTVDVDSDDQDVDYESLYSAAAESNIINERKSTTPKTFSGQLIKYAYHIIYTTHNNFLSI